MPDMHGRIAFGFGDLRQAFDTPVADIQNGNAIAAERMDMSFYQYNQEFYDRMQADFVERTTMAVENYKSAVGGRMQRLDPQHGVPRPTQRYKGYQIGNWIEGFGDAYGDNRVSRRMQTFGDVNRAVYEIQDADRATATESMLSAMFVNRAFQWEDETRLGYRGAGVITVYPLADGDNTPYIKARGRTVGTDDHYLTVEGRISSSNDPFERIKRALTEHGTDPDARVVVYVADDLASDIGGMDQFIPRSRPEVREGANTATVQNVPDRGIGDEVLGVVSGCWIVQASAIPEGYMLAHLVGRKPLSMREYPRTELQGLNREEINVDGNHMQTGFVRIAGYSGRDRVGAAAIQVGVAQGASYTPPEEFALPGA